VDSGRCELDIFIVRSHGHRYIVAKESRSRVETCTTIAAATSNHTHRFPNSMINCLDVSGCRTLHFRVGQHQLPKSDTTCQTDTFKAQDETPYVHTSFPRQHPAPHLALLGAGCSRLLSTTSRLGSFRFGCLQCPSFTSSALLVVLQLDQQLTRHRCEMR
jgi:hypothetical protein